MRTIRIVPHWVWRHDDGRTASIHGAVPWTNSRDRMFWKRIHNGFTWEVVTFGVVTYGLGRLPAKSFEEATVVAENFAKRTGAVFLEEEAA